MRVTGRRSFQQRLTLRALLASLMSLLLAVQPAAAQSILRDAETEALFNDVAAPLVRAAGLDPRSVKVILLQDPEINAFTAGGQAIYIQSGLLVAADNVNQLQGVIAHELGHVAGGHAIRLNEGAKVATGITLLSLLLGAAAMAAGAGEAGMGIMAAGQQAAMGKFLAFSRTQESTADAAGAKYLQAAGESGRGSLAFFKKLQNLEFRYGYAGQIDPYAQTHPLSGERILELTKTYEESPSWNAKTDPALEARFQRVRAKLVGFVSDPKATLVRYPETDATIPAHYARAYAWHRSAYPDKALAEADALLKAAPHDPYFLELKGQVLLESGRPVDALPPLREAVALTGAQPLISATFGHALIATENPTNFAEARTVLTAAVNRDNDNPFAWYQLGVIYDREGDMSRAALATAERYNLEGHSKLALASAEAAMKGIPPGTRDYLRAEDIAMVSKTAVDEDKHKH